MALLDALDVPPCTRFDVISANRHHLRLEGPRATSRMNSAFAGAFGATFAAFALRMARTPIPGPMKAIPLAMAAVGAGITTVAGAKTFMRCSVDFKPAAVTFTWSWRPLPERTLEIRAKEIEAFEVTQAESKRDTDFSTIFYRLNLVKKDGSAIAMEEFDLKTQAELRRKAIEAVVSRR